MQYILAGVLAFDVMDRITGNWTVMNTAWASTIFKPMIHDQPLIWIILNFLAWFLVFFILRKTMQRISFRAEGNIELTIRKPSRISTEALEVYLADRDITQESRGETQTNTVVSKTWLENK